MSDRGVKIRNILLIVMIILLVGVLVYVYKADMKRRNEYSSAIEALNEEAEPYESELRQLKSDLADLESDVSYSSETANIMVGYIISDESDISYIAEQAETYDFSPVVVIDCTDDMEKIGEYVEAVEESWEIMLYAPGFSEDTNENVLEVMDYLEDEGREHTGVFFLRDDDNNDENIRLLLDDGFSGYTLYHGEAPEAGQTEDDAVYFDYSYLERSGTAISSRLAALYRDKTAIILVFDMESIISGTMSESYVEDLFSKIENYTETDDCSFSTVAEVVEEYEEVNDIESVNQADYDEQAEDMQERIDELEEIIDEIYSRLGY